MIRRFYLGVYRNAAFRASRLFDIYSLRHGQMHFSGAEYVQLY